MKFCSVGVLLVAGLLLSGCGSDSSDTAPPPPPPDPEPEAPVEPSYQAPEPGYLNGAEFAPAGQGQVEGWSLSQHSSDDSYTITASEGILTITRTGDEPWGKVRQVFKKEAMEPLIGKRLVFAADVRADFTSEWGEAMEAPGLIAVAKGIPAGSPPILGKSLLFSQKAAVDDLALTTDWHRYEVTFEIPTPEQASSVELEVGFLMTEGGSLYVRGPSLTEAASDSGE